MKNINQIIHSDNHRQLEILFLNGFYCSDIEKREIIRNSIFHTKINILKFMLSSCHIPKISQSQFLNMLKISCGSKKIQTTKILLSSNIYPTNAYMLSILLKRSCIANSLTHIKYFIEQNITLDSLMISYIKNHKDIKTLNYINDLGYNVFFDHIKN